MRDDSETHPPVPAPAPIWSDEFDGTSLDDSKWVTGFAWCPVATCTSTTTPKMAYLDTQVSESGGLLRLRADNVPVTVSGRTYPYRSGMVTTSAYYGEGGPRAYRRLFTPPVRIEWRMRSPKGHGFWPALWLLPPEGVWPPEIDIVEVLGHDTFRAHHHYHWRDVQGALHDQGTSMLNATDLAADFHEYRVDWTAAAITWYVDGIQRFEYAGPGITTTPMYLVANFHVGGASPGDPDASTIWPAYMDLDWVRVYGI